MTKLNDPVKLAFETGVAIISVEAPPVNALSRAVRDGLSAALELAIASDVAAIVLICEGTTFFAGGDVSEFGKPREGISLGALCSQFENSPKPVIAAMHGTALGGGLELALSAHRRIAAEGTKVGLPELKLGLVPGAGGTQRLPRLIGVSNALVILTNGKPIGMSEAKALGLIDQVAGKSDLREAAIALAVQTAAEPGVMVRTRDLEARLAEAKENPELFDAFRKSNAGKARGNPAFEKAVQCVEATISAGRFEDGLNFEEACFLELVRSPESAALRYVFFAERQASKIPGMPPGNTKRDIASVGVIGAGTMGGGIAMCFADFGLPVTLLETSAQALERGLGAIRKNYERSAAHGRIIDEQVQDRLARLNGTMEMRDLAQCDLVIEAVFEDFDVKRSVFEKLDEICRPGAILATNTSAISVDRIAAATKRPQDVAGLHFFSPANVMRLLEVVRGAKTAPDVVETAMGLGRSLGKVAVLSGVCQGFIANRMLKVRQNQAQLLLMEGALPWQVDRALTDFGLPMGPFQMSDLVGLDLGWVKEKSRGETLRDVFCEHGRRGQKTGAGYYDYDDQRNRKPSAEAEQLISEFVARSGKSARIISDDEILWRCIFPVINEGTKILEEGIALRGSDIDVAWVNGFGWPAVRGGPMYYADQTGLPHVVETLTRLSAENDSIAGPSALLLRLAREGRQLSAFGRIVAERRPSRTTGVED